MLYLFIAIISFLASLIGAICGIGGGVIIKPLLDATAIYNTSVISFLSGCTVLSMTAYSVARSARNASFLKKSGKIIILAAGGAVGGVIGKSLFTTLRTGVGNDYLVGAVQSILLMLMTAATFTYALIKHKVKTRKITSVLYICLVGIILGVISAFLGIGGGPINIVILSFCFSMKTKEAAESSLLIILFSQATAFLTTVVTGTIPNVNIFLLCMMMGMGILGGIIGRKINDRIHQKTVDKLFLSLLIIIIGITIYNFGLNLSNIVRIRKV